MSQPLYNRNDGVTGRDGGPYLDELELREAEVRRAAVEGREPDFDNLGSTAGVQLVPAADLLAGATVNSAPSQEAHRDSVLAEALVRLANDAVGANPVAQAPVVNDEADEADEDDEEQEELKF